MNTSSSGPAVALQAIRHRLRNLWSVTDMEPSTAPPEIRKAVNALDDGAAGIIARQVWDPSHPCHGSTQGCTTPITPETAGITWYPGKVSALAAVFACPLSRYHGDPTMLERIEASLRYIEPCLRPDIARNGSWYLWDIGWPEELAQILILCGDHLKCDLRQSLLEILLSLPSKVFQVDRDAGVIHPVESGSNMMHVLHGLLLRGVATDDFQWIAAAAAQIPNIIRKVDGEGIQEDWSYHFHGRGINLGYGLSDLKFQAKWIYLTSGTPWECGDAERELFLGTIREFFRFNIWKGRVSPYATDRAIATPGTIYWGGSPFLFSLMLGIASGFEKHDREMLVATARQTFGAFTPDRNDSLEHLLLVDETRPLMENDSVGNYTGIRYYPESEYLLTHQTEWFAAVRMGSIRTKTWNSQGGAHILGSSSVEFSIALMTDGWEFDHTTIPTMDWSRLMGVTRCDAVECPPEGYGQSAFVGGVADDGMGVMGMQYLLAPPGQGTLRANKTVFVTSSALILLGNRIRCDASASVATTLFHAPFDPNASYRLNGSDLDLSGDGQWQLKAGDSLFLRNVAVRLLHDATLSFTTRKGTYNALNDPHNTTTQGQAYTQEHERRWIYLMTEHGIKPADAAYGAILWPAVTAEFQPEENALEIVQEPDLHRVSDPVQDLGGEVRFPGDFRELGELSYYGAEPFKWGSIARWKPTQDPERYEVTLLTPHRSVRGKKGANTEVFLPSGFELEDVTLITMEGKPFPANLLSTATSPLPKTLKVRRCKKPAAYPNKA